MRAGGLDLCATSCGFDRDTLFCRAPVMSNGPVDRAIERQRKLLGPSRFIGILGSAHAFPSWIARLPLFRAINARNPGGRPALLQKARQRAFGEFGEAAPLRRA